MAQSSGQEFDYDAMQDPGDELSYLLPRPETFSEKMVRKTKENPFVLIGALATGGVLTYGIYTMTSSNPKRSQQLMRLRILTQGFTVFAMVAGVFYNAYTKKPKPVRR
ncbi:hypothetical protein LSH36_274g00035 [Paralvinella palmiformis]|uniref:HIG1 domain-containing protein n=1 Tax=Paralvinella palmiformis TaxID=53620 RepID=A0AAD9N3L9_9ANNE|nr:hypothetical protein LSH36_274g00035 [Paralvinella palmiformis]